MSHKLTRPLVACAILFATAGPLSAVTVVVKEGDLIAGDTILTLSGAAPSINSSGDIAFQGTLATAGSAILSPTSVVVAQGATISGKTLTSFERPVINDTGLVVFEAGFSGGRGVFSPGGVIVQTGDTIGGKTLTALPGSRMDLNNSGVVAFAGDYPGLNGRGVFTQSAFIAGIGSTIDGVTISNISIPAINNNGEVSYAGKFGPFSAFVDSDRVVAPGDTIGGKTLTDISSGAPDINDSGELAFTGFFTGGSGVFTTTSLIAQTGDIVGGNALTSFGAFHSINNSGQVAYRAAFSGGSAVLVDNHPVASTGDVIGGKTLSLVSDATINDQGDVVFYGKFTDGSAAILFASAESYLVPEPSSLGLALCGAILVAFRRRRGR